MYPQTGSIATALGRASPATPAQRHAQAEQALFILHSPQITALADAAYRALSLKLFGAFIEGDLQIQQGLSNDEIMHWANRTFADELHNGVGERLPNRWIITRKRIVHAEVVHPPHGGEPYVLLDLAIRARNPRTGLEGEYQAPVTRGRRNADPTDEELQLPLSALMRRLVAVAHAAMDVELGFDLNHARRQAARRYLQAGGRVHVVHALNLGPALAPPPRFSGIGGLYVTRQPD